jgi:DNA-binding SARP family transcriptional activator/predicted ATPase
MAHHHLFRTVLKSSRSLVAFRIRVIVGSKPRVTSPKWSQRKTHLIDMLRLTLLGKPELSKGGQTVSRFAYRKSLALLAYLAVTGRPHTRDTLIGLFWPEATESNARASLRKTLFDLRRDVEPYLLINRHEVALNQDAPCYLDVRAFEAGVDAGDVSPVGIERLKQAVELYQGEFLEGYYVRDAPGFEDWVLAQRARLRERAFQALYTLASYFSEKGPSERAAGIDYTTRLLALEPWREEAHRQLMLLLAVAGQRGAALAQYETCRQVLTDELGVEPGSETTRLYEQIRDEEFPGERPSRAPQERYQTAWVPLVTLPTTEDASEARRPVFVAREGELARLGTYLDAALDGRGQVVFVTGGPGQGKTALMHEFALRALDAHPDLLVALGNCNAYSGVGDPYLPFREVLGALSGDIAGALSREHAQRLWAAIPIAVQTLLSQGPYLIDTLVPGPPLLGRANAVATAQDAGWHDELNRWLERPRSEVGGLEQSALLAQVANTLRAFSAHHPLLLVLDDLQWADTGSVSLLFHLVRQLAAAGGRALIVGAYRPEEISTSRRIAGQPDENQVKNGQHPLEQVLPETKRYFGDVWLDLTRVDEIEGQRFVNGLVDVEPNRLGTDFRTALARRTRGHPLFTVELLRSMREQGQLIRGDEGEWVEGRDLDWTTIPARAEAAIQARVCRLDEMLHEVLVVASVEGEAFTAQVIARVLDIPERKLLRLLSQELVARHRLVSEAGEDAIGERRFSRHRFAHALFQEYVYNGLSAGERCVLHYQVGAALEELHGDQTDEIAVQLAMHFADADVPKKAMHYYGRAADAAARVFANTEAIDHYRRALEWAKRIDIDSASLVQLYTGLGRAHELNSEFDRAVAVYEEMEQVARQCKDRTIELAALMAHAAIKAVPTSVISSIRAQTLGERALTLARQLGDSAAEAKILWTLSLAYFFDNRLAEAIEYGERSLALARQLDLRNQMAQTLNDLGSFCYMYSGHIEQANAALGEATALWRELDNLPMLADSLSSSAVAHVYAGEYDRALAASEEAFGISASIDNVWGKSYRLWKLGLVFAEWGEWSRALNAMQECIRLGELAGFMPSQTYTRADLAALYGELGATARAMELVQLALSVGESHKHLTDRGPILAVQASLYLRDGDLAAAAEAIEAAKASPYLDTWRVYGIPVRLTDAQLALALGEHDRAVGEMEHLLVDLQQFGTWGQVPYALYVLGRALAELGKPKEARERWLEACSHAEAMGSQRILWRITHALSHFEPDPAVAERLGTKARQVLRSIVEHIDDLEVRESFLRKPDVRAVLEPARVGVSIVEPLVHHESVDQT